MATLSSHTRFGYIRTISDRSKDSSGAAELINICMGKSRTKRLDTRQHCFLITATGTTDAYVLDQIISRIPIKVAACKAPASSIRSADYTENFTGVERSNFELHMPSSRAATKKGQKIMQYCKEEGIETRISGITDDECDEILLCKSHYLIDFLTPTLFHDCSPWTNMSLSHRKWLDNIISGSVQDNALTNPNYEKFDISRERLRNRYAPGASSKYQRSGCAAFNQNYKRPYRCYSCGGKCKRGKCSSTPSPENLEWVESEARWRKWRENCKAQSEWRNKHWYELSSDDMSNMFGTVRDGRKWKSIATFSGD